MSLRRGKLRSGEDLDPMSSAVNMTDIMLVLAVGFLIFAVMSTGAQNMNQAMSQQQSMQQQQQSMQQQQAQTTELDNNQTQQLNETPENVTKSGSGYQEMGKVYQDHSTGKMVMVSS